MKEDKESRYDPESSEAILDTAKVKYVEEQERFKQTEFKINIALAFNGILFGIYLTYIQDFLPSDSVHYMIYTLIVKFIILLLFSISIGKFLRSITVAEFHQIKLDGIIDLELAKQDSSITKLQIASTYREAIDINKKSLDLKIRHYEIGLCLLKWGFFIFIVHFLIEEVIKYV